MGRKSSITSRKTLGILLLIAIVLEFVVPQLLFIPGSQLIPEVIFVIVALLLLIS